MGEQLRMARDSEAAVWAREVLLGLMTWATAHNVRLNGSESAVVFGDGERMLTGVRASPQGTSGYLDGGGYVYVGSPASTEHPPGTKLD